jgi:outer membrane protein OmpA-like peptidoglycan-associated protein
MKMDNALKKSKLIIIFSLIFIGLTACTFNPFISSDHTTGNPSVALLGGAGTAGAISLLGGPKPVMAFGGFLGGGVAYYLTTLRSDARGIYQARGQVYKVGYYIGIYIPSDSLFEPNTAEFVPNYQQTLDSVITVLSRSTHNNILVSGNTSGFALPHWEKKLTLARAKAVADYLWRYGACHFKDKSLGKRELSYVAYGNYFPIASDITNRGIRENSRIQITGYPSDADIFPGKYNVLYNVGSLNDQVGLKKPPCTETNQRGECVRT